METIYLLVWNEPRIAYVGATRDLTERTATHLSGRDKRTSETVATYGPPDVTTLEIVDDPDTQKIELEYARSLRKDNWIVLNAPRGGYAPYLSERGGAATMKLLHAEKLPDGRSRHAAYIGETYTRKASAAAHAVKDENGKSVYSARGGRAAGPKNGKALAARRRKCDVCDLTTNPGNLGRHQMRTGHIGYSEKTV